jgi:hypothetical protein
LTIERKIANIFQLTPDNWMRHANPWSVWTRYSVLPLIILAFWSRIWIGNLFWIPATASILWIFFNPIFFKKPKSTRNWASKSVMGERVYLNRDKIAIPKIHQSGILKILNFISFTGMVLSIWGIIELHIWLSILGTALAYLGKSWYLDRMVWLFEDMKNDNEEYKSWDY